MIFSVLFLFLHGVGVMGYSKDSIDFVVIDLPYPISANRMYTYVPKLRAPVRSKQYLSYLKEVQNMWRGVRHHGRVDMGEAVMVWMLVYPPRADADLDNVNKVLFDCLESSDTFTGAYSNDKYIVSTHQEKMQRLEGGMVRVFIAAEHRRDDLTSCYWQQANAGILSRRHDVGKIKPRPRYQVAINPVLHSVAI
jgi:Holliday junction resolvase RusA-like endonuclease